MFIKVFIFRVDGIRIVVVLFGIEVKLEFNLRDVNVDMMEKVIEVIDKIMYMGGVIVFVFVL